MTKNRPLTRFRARAARKIARKILWERSWYEHRAAVHAAWRRVDHGRLVMRKTEHQIAQDIFEQAVRDVFDIAPDVVIRFQTVAMPTTPLTAQARAESEARVRAFLNRLGEEIV